MSSGALFGNNASRGASKNLVEFKAGKMTMKGKMVYPDTRKGQLYVYQSDDSLMHFCWKDRTTGVVEDVRWSFFFIIGFLKEIFLCRIYVNLLHSFHLEICSYRILLCILDLNIWYTNCLYILNVCFAGSDHLPWWLWIQTCSPM